MLKDGIGLGFVNRSALEAFGDNTEQRVMVEVLGSVLVH